MKSQQKMSSLHSDGLLTLPVLKTSCVAISRIAVNKHHQKAKIGTRISLSQLLETVNAADILW